MNRCQESSRVKCPGCARIYRIPKVASPRAKLKCLACGTSFLVPTTAPLSDKAPPVDHLQRPNDQPEVSATAAAQPQHPESESASSVTSSRWSRLGSLLRGMDAGTWKLVAVAACTTTAMLAIFTVVSVMSRTEAASPADDRDPSRQASVDAALPPQPPEPDRGWNGEPGKKSPTICKPPTDPAETRSPAQLAVALQEASANTDLKTLAKLVDASTPEGAIWMRRIHLLRGAKAVLAETAALAREKYGNDADSWIQEMDTEWNRFAATVTLGFSQPLEPVGTPPQALVGKADGSRFGITPSGGKWFVRLDEHHLNVVNWAADTAVWKDRLERLVHCPRMVEHASRFQEFQTELSRAVWIQSNFESEDSLELLLYPIMGDTEREQLYIQTKVSWALQQAMAFDDFLRGNASDGPSKIDIYPDVPGAMIGLHVSRRMAAAQEAERRQNLMINAWSMLSERDHRLAEMYCPDFVATVRANQQ